METRAKLAYIDTISNFKNLKRIFHKSTNFDGFDQVLEEAKVVEEPKPTIKPKLTTPSMQISIKQMKKNGFMEAENILIGNYRDSIAMIKAKDKRIRDLREINNQNKQQIKVNKEKLGRELQILDQRQKKLNAIRTNPNEAQNDQTTTPINLGQSVVFFFPKTKNINIEDLKVYREIENRRTHLSTSINNTIEMITGDIEQVSGDIDRLEKEVNQFKMKKILYRYKLKEFYASIIRNPSETL